ncbi:MAG: septum formation initiator family protein [bacterium]
MYNRKEKKPKSFWQRILYSQIIIFIGIFFIIIFSIGISNRIARKNQINKETKQLQDEIDKLTENGKELNELLAYLNSNDFLEEEARTKLGLKKDGEQIVIINNNGSKSGDNKITNSSPRIYRSAEPAQKSNPRKWRDYFFDVN